MYSGVFQRIAVSDAACLSRSICGPDFLFRKKLTPTPALLLSSLSAPFADLGVSIERIYRSALLAIDEPLIVFVLRPDIVKRV